MYQHDKIDRISPTLEPDEQVVMHQKWHHLLFLHWEVPAADLQALLPPQLTVDLYEGKAYVGLIPFTLSGVRPILMPPLPGVSSFHEINVRTYVHLKGENPGVWFFSLDASSSLAVTAARAFYKLAYYDAEIAFTATGTALPEIEFHASRTDPKAPQPAHAHLSYRPVESVSAASIPGTLEHFLMERYILYSQDEARQLYRARVHHQPYAVQQAEIAGLDETLIWAAGIRRSENQPIRHYSPGVDVKVYPLHKC